MTIEELLALLSENKIIPDKVDEATDHKGSFHLWFDSSNPFGYTKSTPLAIKAALPKDKLEFRASSINGDYRVVLVKLVSKK